MTEEEAFKPLRGLPEETTSIMHEQAEHVNPFVNDSVRTGLRYYAKLALGVCFLVPLRLVLLTPVIASVFVLAKLATLGLAPPSDHQSTTPPYARWRRALLVAMRFLIRTALFIFGFYWIEERGRPDPTAPIIVAKHVSYWEPAFFASRLSVSPVSATANSKGVVGVVMRALQALLVDRESTESRKGAATAIRQRAELCMQQPGRYPPVLLFPEGTTATKALISFKLGAFAPGVPVQPVNVSYPHGHFDPSWSFGISAPMSLLLTTCQLYNRLQIDWLPLYRPSPAEQASPQLYATNVRHAMAARSGLPVTEHGYADVVLRFEAAKLSMEADFALVIAPIVERMASGIDIARLKDMLRAFRQADTDSSGSLDYNEFCRAVRLQPSPLLRQLFDLIDADGSGTIDFREWLLSLGLMSTTHAVPDLTLRLAFTIFDGDGDGLVARHEFCDMVRRLRPQYTADTCRDLFDSIDTDGSGNITFDDFKAYSRSNPVAASLLSESLYQNRLIPTPTRLVSTPDRTRPKAE